MIKFLDGPAAGVELELRRVPRFLRVVRSGEGAWDALDLLDDQPADDEQIVVYEVVPNTTSTVHFCRRRRGQKSGWMLIAEYAVVPVQPADELVRATDAWHNWVCLAAGIPRCSQPGD